MSDDLLVLGFLLAVAVVCSALFIFWPYIVKMVVAFCRLVAHLYHRKQRRKRWTSIR